MKTTNKFVLLLSFCLILFISCGKKQIKYEEDPKQTRLTPAQRLRGGWLLDDYTFNGNSIIESLIARKNLSSGGVVVVLNYFEENFEEKRPERKLFDQFKGNSVEIKVDEFHITVTDSIANFWFTQPFHYKPIKNAVWKVTKLFQNDFNITLSTDTGTYKMFFKKE